MEQALNSGDLLVHYQTPLIDGNDVYMESKAGSYTKGAYNTQTWHQNKFSWINGQLTKVWTFDSDWVPPGGQADFWEPVYHAALANGVVYDPGAGGSIFKLDKSSGTAIKRIVPTQFLHPDGTLDPQTYTVSPLTADSSGNIYYNVLKIQDNGNFYGMDAVDSWLVKVAPDDSINLVSYTGLNPAAPKATDLCLGIFSSTQLPWPPSADAVPPSVPCGLQRVGINIAPAIAADGTIYTLTRGHFLIGARHSFLLAINPDLTLKWASSLRNRFSRRMRCARLSRRSAPAKRAARRLQRSRAGRQRCDFRKRPRSEHAGSWPRVGRLVLNANHRPGWKRVLRRVQPIQLRSGPPDAFRIRWHISRSVQLRLGQHRGYFSAQQDLLRGDQRQSLQRTRFVLQ